MTPYEILTKAQDLIRDPKNWTQGAYARTAIGTPVLSRDEDAVCFCSLGAISKAAKDARLSVNTKSFLRTAIRDRCEYASIDTFNDNHTHAEVMSAFDRARDLASQEGQA